MAKRENLPPDAEALPEKANPENNPADSKPKKGRPKKAETSAESPKKQKTATSRKKTEPKVKEEPKTETEQSSSPDLEQEDGKSKKKAVPKEPTEIKEITGKDAQKTNLENLDPFTPYKIDKLTEEDKEQLVALSQHTHHRIKDVAPLLGHNRKLVEGKDGEDYIMGESIYWSEKEKRETIEAIKRGEEPKETLEPEDRPGFNDPIEVIKRREKAAKEQTISEEAFNDRTRKLWVEHAVHAMLNNGEWESRSDLDGNSYLELLKLAGIKFDPADVSYVKQGEYKEGALSGDTGGVDGVQSLEGGKTTIIDHHGEQSGRDSSATKNVYFLLVRLGLLKQEECLDKFVQFVTDEDNKNYTDEQFDYLYKDENLPKTVVGLSENLTPSQLIDFFRAGGNRFQILPDSFLGKVTGVNIKTNKTVNLLSASKEVKNKLDTSIANLAKIEQEGFVVDTGETGFGKIVIDMGEPTSFRDKDTGKIVETERWRVPIGLDLARAKGYGGFVKYNPNKSVFKVFTTKPLGERGITFPQGFSMRGAFWNKPESDPTPLVVGIQEILQKLAGEDWKLNLTGKLKEYVEKEEGKLVARRSKNNRENMEFTDEELKSLFNWAEYARDRNNEIEEEIRDECGKKGLSEEKIKNRIDEEIELFWEKEIFDVIAECLSDHPSSFTMREELIYQAVEKIKNINGIIYDKKFGLKK